jgi:hypothetical protein
MEEVTSGAQCLPGRFHGWRSHGLIVEAQHGLVDFEFSRHESRHRQLSSLSLRAAPVHGYARSRVPSNSAYLWEPPIGLGCGKVQFRTSTMRLALVAD